MIWAAYGDVYWSKLKFPKSGCVFDEEKKLWLYEGDVPPHIKDGVRFFPHPLPEGWAVDTYYGPDQVGKVVRSPSWSKERDAEPSSYRVVLHTWFQVTWLKPEAAPVSPSRNNFLANKRGQFWSVHRPLDEKESQGLAAAKEREAAHYQSVEDLRVLGMGEPDCLSPSADFAVLASGVQGTCREVAVYEFDGAEIGTGMAWWVIVTGATDVWVVDCLEEGDNVALGDLRVHGRRLPPRLCPDARRLLETVGAARGRRWEEYLQVNPGACRAG